MHKSCININLQTLKNTSKEEKTMNLKGRNFLTLKDYTEEEITYLLDLAAELKEKKKKGISRLMPHWYLCWYSFLH